jgi:hypothetical protein
MKREHVSLITSRQNVARVDLAGILLRHFVETSEPPEISQIIEIFGLAALAY